MQKTLIKFPKLNQIVEQYNWNVDQHEMKQAFPTRYTFIIDVSGSMYNDLPKLREDMKNNLANTLKKGDCFSLIYYSSNGDYGFILKDYQFTDVGALQSAQNSIDLLECRSLTGFCDPLNLATSYLDEKNDNYSNVVVFMSDGYENQNPRNKVIEATEKLAAKINAGIVVEYGNYANHDLLVQMADILGSFSFANNIHDYRANVENVLKNQYSATYNTFPHESDIEEVFSFDENGMITKYQNKEGEYKVPEGVNPWVLRTKEQQPYTMNASEREYLKLLLALIHIKQLKNESARVWQYLGELGSIELIDLYNKAIGKQRINEFLSIVQDYLADTVGLFNKGKDLSYLPAEDAYCVFDFIKDFQAGENKIFTRHEDFNYKRIGAKKEQATAVLTKEDKKMMANVSSLDEVKKLIQNKYKVNFEYATQDLGISLDNLVWNSSRANLSFNTYNDVIVDLRQIPEFNKLQPNATERLYDFYTHIYRAYTLINDGVLNIDKLPCSLDYNTLTKFHAQGLIEKDYKNGTYLVNISSLPIVNRFMLKNINIEKFINLNYQSLKLGAGQKVYNSLIKEHFPLSKGEGFIEKYGEEFTAKLKEWGITEHNGFNPPTVAMAGSDVYYAPTVDIKFKGISSIPSLNSIVKKIEEGKKLTPREELLNHYYQDYKEFLNSDSYKDTKNKDEKLKKYLEHQQNIIRIRKRQLDGEISKILFAAFLSRFNFENELENGQFTIEHEGEEINGVIEQKEVEIKL